MAQYAHPNLNLSLVWGVIVENHRVMVAQSSDASNLIWMPALAPETLAQHLPQALWEGLFRPYLWEPGHWLKKMAALENTALMLLALAVLWQGIRRTAFPWQQFQYLWLMTCGYLLMLATLLPLAAPNIGNLVRYRVGYLPIIVGMMLAYIWPNIKKDKITY
jgi:hypothetical protein